MKKVKKLNLLIDYEEAKYMNELNKKNQDRYLMLVGDEEYKDLIKKDALLFYSKYLTENSNGYTTGRYADNILNKFINIKSYIDTENYNTILFKLTKEFNNLEYPFTKRYFELLEQICVYKLYKFIYETFKLDDSIKIENEDEKFTYMQMKFYEYLDAFLGLSYISGSYENSLFNEFAERLIDVEEKIKKKEFNADIMYFAYCRTTLNKCEKEKARQRAIKKYYSNNYNFKETEK